MKKLGTMKALLILILNLSVLICLSQSVVYEDNYDSGYLSVSNPPAGYAIDIVDEAFQIVGNGNASPWASMNYMMHDDGSSPSIINASASPKLYIRAKGSGQPEVRIDFQDQSGYMTNLEPVDITLNENYNVYELDYSNHLNDGAFGGPCPVSPCPVDPANIQGLLLFVDAADGGYEGTIDIDWITVGAPLDGAVVTVEHEIRYNQVTYLTGQRKIISVVADSPFENLEYRIFGESSGTPIMTNSVTGNSRWQPSQEYVANVDISAIDQPGNYTFETALESIEFMVSEDGYEDLCEASLKYYYYNRASQELTSEYAGSWSRPLGHPDQEVIVHASAASESRPTGTIISSPKGWYDAGDYNKYIVNSGISTYTLLAAYEHYPDYYNNLSIDIPEQNNDLPDILDEIIWNLDWMLTMQDPEDGGVYHKLTGLNFSGIIMPHQYNLDRYVVQKSTAAALNFAAVTAVAARIFSEFEAIKPGYSDKLLSASESAYTWAKSNPSAYYVQPSNVNTGEYGDSNVQDEFQWAASELYITTRNSLYLTDININQIGNGIPSWQYTAPLALISLANHGEDLGNDIDIDVINNRLLQTANQLRGTVALTPLRVAMGLNDNDFIWGSNGHAANQIMILIRAYELEDDLSYLQAAYIAIDYLLGRNGTGYCYISGFGELSPLKPHHRQSQSDNFSIPVPGMLAGGPNPDQQDGCSNYIGNLPANSYVDSWCSYASNEVTINWNAPLAYVVNALHFYQNGISSSVQEVSRNETYALQVLPNPGSNTVYLPQIREGSNQELQIYSQSGQVVLQLSSTLSPYIDVSQLAKGIYICRLIDQDKIYTTRWLKVD